MIAFNRVLVWASILGVILSINVFVATLLNPERKDPLMLSRDTSVMALYGQDLDGNNLQINLAAAEKPFLFFVFNPICGRCESAGSAWHALRHNAMEKNAIYIAIATSGSTLAIKDYLRRHRLAPDVTLYKVPRSIRQALGITGVPMTMYFEPSKKDIISWTGAPPETRDT